MEKLTISYRLKSAEEDPHGTWYFHKEYNRVVLKSARKEAERLSLKGYDQVEILLKTEDDPEIQEYWQNGKLLFKIF